MNNGAMDILEHVSWSIYVKISLHNSRSGTAGSCFIFLGYAKVVVPIQTSASIA